MGKSAGRLDPDVDADAAEGEVEDALGGAAEAPASLLYIRAVNTEQEQTMIWRLDTAIDPD